MIKLKIKYVGLGAVLLVALAARGSKMTAAADVIFSPDETYSTQAEPVPTTANPIEAGQLYEETAPKTPTGALSDQTLPSTLPVPTPAPSPAPTTAPPPAPTTTPPPMPTTAQTSASTTAPTAAPTPDRTESDLQTVSHPVLSPARGPGAAEENKGEQMSLEKEAVQGEPAQRQTDMKQLFFITGLFVFVLVAGTAIGLVIANRKNSGR